MPPKSTAQARLMHGICKGSIKPGKGKPSREVACEFVGRKPGGKRRR